MASKKKCTSSFGEDVFFKDFFSSFNSWFTNRWFFKGSVEGSSPVRPNSSLKPCRFQRRTGRSPQQALSMTSMITTMDAPVDGKNPAITS